MHSVVDFEVSLTEVLWCKRQKKRQILQQELVMELFQCLYPLCGTIYGKSINSSMVSQ